MQKILCQYAYSYQIARTKRNIKKINKLNTIIICVFDRYYLKSNLILIYFSSFETIALQLIESLSILILGLSNEETDLPVTGFELNSRLTSDRTITMFDKYIFIQFATKNEGNIPKSYKVKKKDNFFFVKWKLLKHFFSKSPIDSKKEHLLSLYISVTYVSFILLEAVLFAFASIADDIQTAHPCRLVLIFTVRKFSQYFFLLPNTSMTLSKSNYEYFYFEILAG